MCKKIIFGILVFVIEINYADMKNLIDDSITTCDEIIDVVAK